MPNVRGLNSTYGIGFIPGTWINSIDIGKGVGSVVNGYESINGAMNVELIKPEHSDKLMYNAYVSSLGRAEANVVYADTLNAQWGTVFLSHASSQLLKIDRNADNFLDTPLYQQINLMNRWRYQSEKFAGQFGLKYLVDDKTGGQENFDPERDRGTASYYGFGSKTNRIEAFGKMALLFPSKPYQGLGMILNYTNHQNDSYFGLKNYSGKQKSFYTNLIYQNIINNTNHTYKTGMSFLNDQYNEQYLDSNFVRNEVVPGLFFEYNYTLPQKLNIIVGIRNDWHNLYGTRFTPRIHMKYDLSPDLALRLNAGRGWRMPNAIAENFGMLLNARNLKFKEKILPEVADNFGASLSKDFSNDLGKGTIIADYYFTNFRNQLLVDMEYHHDIAFYNQVGRSFSKTYQLELNFSTYKRLDLKLAYRYSDVQNSFLDENGSIYLTERQFINRSRLLFNIGYATKFEKWKFDFTWQQNGPMRVPIFDHALIGVEEKSFSPAFAIFNAQVTKKFKHFEWYVGGENLGNFTQKNPIVDWQNPFGQSFDASMVWGPVFGRVIYSGLRYNISK